MQEAEQGNIRCQGDSSHRPCPLGAPGKKSALWSATGCDIYSHFYRLWVASDPNATWEFLGLITSCVNVTRTSAIFELWAAKLFVKCIQMSHRILKRILVVVRIDFIIKWLIIRFIRHCLKYPPVYILLVMTFACYSKSIWFDYVNWCLVRIDVRYALFCGY